MATRDPRFEESAARKLKFTKSLARENGWVDNNCLGDPNKPLLHTIAYTLQGMLECGEILGDREARDIVLSGCWHLAESFRKNDGLYGRYDSDWNPTVRWRCLTGEAQLRVEPVVSRELSL